MAKNSNTRLSVFTLKILDLTPIYSFSGQAYAPEDFLTENLALEVKTKCVYPVEFNGREVSGIIKGSRDLRPRSLKNDEEAETAHIGDLEISNRKGNFFCLLPFDMIVPLLTFFNLGKLPLITFSGEPLRRAKSEIISVRFPVAVD
jgi:hypothetical protein